MIDFYTWATPNGWKVSVTKWVLGGAWGERVIGGYECERVR